MNDYKLATIFDISKHIQRINCPFRSAITIYTRAKIHNRKYNIYDSSTFENSRFEKAMYTSYNGGLYYHSYYKDRVSIIEQCYHEQENIF